MIIDFGYLGLLLLVFEGGLETCLDVLAVKSNLFLPSAISFTGILTLDWLVNSLMYVWI
jgi:hypothetical protein